MLRIVTENKIDDGTVNINDVFASIVQSIDAKKFLDEDTFYDIALLLRKGLDPNLRIGEDKVHILAYMYLKAYDNSSRFKLLILLLLSYGSDPSSIVSEGTSQSIIDWSADNFLSNVYGGRKSSASKVSLPSRIKNIDLYTRNTLGYLTGNKDFLKKDIEEDDIIIIIRSLTSDAFFDEDTSEEMYPKNLVKFFGPDRLVLSQAVKYGDPIIVNFYSRLGILPSYGLVNRIILQYREQKEDILKDIYKRMLHYLIKDGVRIDSYQRNLMSDVGLNFDDEYKTPYWGKICKNLQDTKKIQRRIKVLSLSIGIKYNYCEKLEELSQYKFEDIKSFLLGNRKNQLLLELDTIGKQIDESILEEICLTHVEEFIFVLRNGDKVSCYSSDQFKMMIEGRRDHDGNILPNGIIDILDDKLRVLERYGVDQPIDIETGLTKLFKEDTYDDDMSNEALRRLYTELDDRQSRSFKTANKDFLNSVLIGMGYIADIDKLNPEHAKVTYARIYDRYKKINPTAASEMLSSL